MPAGNAGPPDRLRLYERVVDAMPGVERKGATMPYTSRNGHPPAEADETKIGQRVSDAADGALIRGLTVLLVVLAGCTADVFSDGEPLEPYEPPSPRNACEQVFGAELMMEIGTAIEPPAAPTAESVRMTFEACSAEELVAANEYFVYAIGPQMGRLLAYRLPIDPGDLDDLIGMCADEVLAATQACELPAPS